MSKRRLGRSQIGYTNEEVPWAYSWNPFGFGCSGCDLLDNGCWAQSLAKRFIQCPSCRAFKVHMHPERLEEPANTKRAGVVLCNFTNDWLDEERAALDIADVIDAMSEAPWHKYVTLTKRASMAAKMGSVHALTPNWWWGLTLRNQAEADEKLPTFISIPANRWLSIEPMQSAIDLTIPRGGCMPPVLGAIVGHDNRRGAPGTETLDHIRSVVRQCQAARVKVYVKQLWDEVDTKGGWRLLRASHEDEFALYPDDLKLRDLPWSMPEAD